MHAEEPQLLADVLTHLLWAGGQDGNPKTACTADPLLLQDLHPLRLQARAAASRDQLKTPQQASTEQTSGTAAPTAVPPPTAHAQQGPQADLQQWTEHLLQVDRRHASELSYAAFVQAYMEPNRPVLIQGAMSTWRAVQEWVHADGSPCVAALVRAAGPDARITVTDTNKQRGDGARCQHTTLRRYMDWWMARQPQQQMVGCKSYGLHGHMDCKACQELLLQRKEYEQQQGDAMPRDSSTGTAEEAEHEGLLPADAHWYLKDWHLVAACPGYEPYHVPIYFASDWLNEHYDRQQVTISTQQPQPQLPMQQQVSHQQARPAVQPQQQDKQPAGRQEQQQAEQREQQHRQEQEQQEQQQLGLNSTSMAADVSTTDYRFVYLGPAGSWTPLHSDVLRSYSWSANVAGRKLWLLLPPEHTHLTYDLAMAIQAPNFAVEPPCCEYTQQATPEELRMRFPNLLAANQHLYGLVQEAGELLFVPSGWHHSVVNLMDTLSINHNWFNAHNIHWCWQLVKSTYLRAAESLVDCRPLCSEHEWWGLVEKLLDADCGLSLRGLGDLCAGIMRRTLTALDAWEQQAETLCEASRDAQFDGQSTEGMVDAVTRGCAAVPLVLPVAGGAHLEVQQLTGLPACAENTMAVMSTNKLQHLLDLSRAAGVLRQVLQLQKHLPEHAQHNQLLARSQAWLTRVQRGCSQCTA